MTIDSGPLKFRLKALENSLVTGRKLMGAVDPAEAHEAFEKWVTRVANLIPKLPNGDTLLREWATLPPSVLAVGPHRLNDSQTWDRFYTAVNQRLTWLKNLLARFGIGTSFSSNPPTLRGQPHEKRNGGPVFIGHGRSLVWLQLRDFLERNLQLRTDEFNRTSVAGRSTKERLDEMLNNAAFAFLIMTAEDERPDGTIHARENVVHEVGLFQGKLGFSRAIVLLEHGCSTFSNIHGLTYIGFTKNDISPAFEEIRQVLMRESIAG